MSNINKKTSSVPIPQAPPSWKTTTISNVGKADVSKQTSLVNIANKFAYYHK